MTEFPENESIKKIPKYEKTNNREIKLLFKLSTGETVKGSIDINKNSRTSDFLKTDRAPFLTVHTVQNKAIQEGVMFIHKEHIVYVVPVDD